MKLEEKTLTFFKIEAYLQSNVYISVYFGVFSYVHTHSCQHQSNRNVEQFQSSRRLSHVHFIVSSHHAPAKVVHCLTAPQCSDPFSVVGL